jgi:hypothetical protein
MRNLTIFAPSHGAHSYAKIHFAVGEKDESAQTAANEFISREFSLSFAVKYAKITQKRKCMWRGSQKTGRLK